MKTEIEIISENIRALRLKNRMSRRAFARVMGVSPATLRRLEQGELPPRLGVDSLLRLCGHFHLNPSQLLHR